jgi:hypothetical protein
MAVLVATSSVNNIAGNKYVTYAQIPAASNADTWDAAVVGMRTVDFATCVPNDASTVAADSVSVTWSGSVVTFNVAGTARAQALTVYGRSHPVK